MKQSSKLITMHLVQESVMLSITGKDKKTAMWRRKQNGVRDTIKKTRFNGHGNIIRTEENRWTTRLTNRTTVHIIECVADRRRDGVLTEIYFKLNWNSLRRTMMASVEKGPCPTTEWGHCTVPRRRRKKDNVVARLTTIL